MTEAFVTGYVILGWYKTQLTDCKYVLKRKKKMEEALVSLRRSTEGGKGRERFPTEVLIVILMYLCCYSFLCRLVYYRNRR